MSILEVLTTRSSNNRRTGRCHNTRLLGAILLACRLYICTAAIYSRWYLFYEGNAQTKYIRGAAVVVVQEHGEDALAYAE
jgi:hypothetical protein